MQKATDKLFSLLFNILLIAIILFSSYIAISKILFTILIFFILLNKRLDFWNDVMHCKIEVIKILILIILLPSYYISIFIYLRSLYIIYHNNNNNNNNFPGTEQTALDVIAWVRSQVYRHSRRACTDLLIKTWWDWWGYVRTTRTFIYRLLGRMVWCDFDMSNYHMWLSYITYKFPYVWVNIDAQTFNTWPKNIGLFRPMIYVTLNRRFWVNDVGNGHMYGANKPSSLINDTGRVAHFFPKVPVRSAMPKNVDNMYGTNRPWCLINDTSWVWHFLQSKIFWTL